MWCGIVNGRVLLSYLFEETVTSARYLDFLQNELISNLITFYPNLEQPNQFYRDIIFQHDGTSPH